MVFISGTINSGKSTVARMLAEKIPNTAVIEVDRLREFVEWMPITEAVALSLENAVAVIKNIVKHKINCVVPYPLSRKNYDYLISELAEVVGRVECVTLAPRMEVVLGGRGGRKLTDWERERVKYHDEIGLNRPEFGGVIDNSELTPAQTVAKVVEYLGGRVR